MASEPNTTEAGMADEYDSAHLPPEKRMDAQHTHVGRVEAGDTISFEWPHSTADKTGVVTDFWVGPDGLGATVLVQTDEYPHGRAYDISTGWILENHGRELHTTVEFASSDDGEDVFSVLYVEIPQWNVVRATVRVVACDPTTMEWRTTMGVSRSIQLDDDGRIDETGYVREDLKPYNEESWRTLMATQIANRDRVFSI